MCIHPYTEYIQPHINAMEAESVKKIRKKKRSWIRLAGPVVCLKFTNGCFMAMWLFIFSLYAAVYNWICQVLATNFCLPFNDENVGPNKSVNISNTSFHKISNLNECVNWFSLNKLLFALWFDSLLCLQCQWLVCLSFSHFFKKKYVFLSLMKIQNSLSLHVDTSFFLFRFCSLL